jgi:hypothetical protein
MGVKTWTAIVIDPLRSLYVVRLRLLRSLVFSWFVLLLCSVAPEFLRVRFSRSFELSVVLHPLRILTSLFTIICMLFCVVLCCVAPLRIATALVTFIGILVFVAPYKCTCDVQSCSLHFARTHLTIVIKIDIFNDHTEHMHLTINLQRSTATKMYIILFNVRNVIHDND